MPLLQKSVTMSFLLFWIVFLACSKAVATDCVTESITVKTSSGDTYKTYNANQFLQQAIEDANTIDAPTIIVGPGEFPQMHVFTINKLTIYSTCAPIFGGIVINNSTNITLIGIKVNSPTKHNLINDHHNSAIVVHNANNIILDNVDINNAAHSGLYAVDSDGIFVENSDINGSTFSGIYLQAVNDVIIFNNNIANTSCLNRMLLMTR